MRVNFVEKPNIDINSSQSIHTLSLCLEKPLAKYWATLGPRGLGHALLNPSN